MARSRRLWINQDIGSYHIISRVAGGDLMFNQRDKDYLLNLVERFVSGFFIRIHAFCFMSSHFHILVTSMEHEANQASEKELKRRYRLLYPATPGPPGGTFDGTFKFIPDDDGGIKRLRRRLGSISCFIQEIKQSYSRWYNKKYNRTGYLWGGRFKAIAVSRGEAQLACSAYIDLNPVRANIVQRPEDYRWSSLGLRVRSPGRANNFLLPLSLLPTGDGIEMPEVLAPLILSKKSHDHFSTYREFVHFTGKIEKHGVFNILPEVVQDVADYHADMGISDRFRYKLKNFSRGLVFGNYGLIAHLQEQWKRKFIRPRSFMGRDKSCNWSFTTRVLRL